MDIRILIFLSVLSGVISCKPQSFDSKADFIRHASEPRNGLMKTQKFNNDICVSLMLVPSTFFSVEDDNKGLYEDNLYMLLRFSQEGKELLGQLPKDIRSAYLQTFSFSMDRYIKARIEGKELQPKATIFQPTYRMTNSNDIVVVFDKNKIIGQGPIELVLSDIHLGFGELLFAIEESDLNYISKVKILNL